MVSSCRVITRRNYSGWSRSPSGVEPTRSQKTTLIRFRTSALATAGVSGAPQWPQNLKPSGFSKLQRGQAGMTPSGLPQETPELDAQPGFATPGHHLASGDLWPLVDAAVADEQEGNRIRRDPAIHRPGRWWLDGKPAVDEAKDRFGAASQADRIAGRNASYCCPINTK